MTGPRIKPTTVVTRTPAGTARAGALIGRRMAPGGVVGLVGDLGAGKTVIAGGIFRGAGLPPGVVVASPTFTLVNSYPGPVERVHVDLYRLESAREAEDAGIVELVEARAGRIVVVEWFEKFPELWPSSFVRVDISIVDAKRRMLRVLEVRA